MIRTRVIGIRIINMALERLLKQMVKVIPDSGRKTSKLGMERKFGLTAVNSRDILKIRKSKALELMFGLSKNFVTQETG